jgi:hypothetical protein
MKIKEDICYVCKGTGKTDQSNFSYCKKCKGRGRLDWIEKALGNNKDYPSIEEEITNEMAKQLAKDIDDKILNELKKEICKSSAIPLKYLVGA